jgi:hypothetical protein
MSANYFVEDSSGNFLLTKPELFDILLSADNSKDREQYLRRLNRKLNPVFTNL